MRKTLLGSLVFLLSFGVLTPAHAAPVYQFPVTGCEVNFARAHHDYAASDILAKAGCKFVAPIDGVIDEVSRVDTWSGRVNLGITRGGRSVSLIGCRWCSILRITPSFNSFKHCAGLGR
jgi:peptidoglycan LD-endopeptidase LytH